MTKCFTQLCFLELNGGLDSKHMRGSEEDLEEMTSSVFMKD